MITQLTGILLNKQPPFLVIDVQGVGYEVEAPLSVFYNLPDNGEKIVLLTHLIVKEDSHTLYGFGDAAERQLFRNLLKISGVGAKLALTLLSGVSAEEFSRIVTEEDVAALVRLPGIGKKTAERLIIEMRDKLDGIAQVGVTVPGRAAGGGANAEASHALAALGYKPAEVTRMIKQVAQSGMEAGEIIRLALQSTVNKG